MALFELTLVLLLIAVALTALSRRLEIPYPSLLALAGVGLAFVPGAPTIEIDPELALALFIAPVLLDAAYDTSLRDLNRYRLPLVALALGAVIFTAAVVAFVGWKMAGLPIAAAIALGAIVAPPDAVAAGAVLGQFKVPHRITAILQGESLLNDATALLDLPVGGFGSLGSILLEQRRPDDLAGDDRQPGRGLCAWAFLAADAQPDRGCGEQHGGAIRRNICGLDPGRQARPFGHHHHRRLCDDHCAHGAAPACRPDGASAPIRSGSRQSSCSTCWPSC